MTGKQWAALSVLLPIIGALIILYSDVQMMKATKADASEVSSIRIDFTKQMTRNTAAIESLSEVMKEMKTFLNSQRRL